MAIEKIGELVGILREEFEAEHVDIPWVQIKR